MGFIKINEKWDYLGVKINSDCSQDNDIKYRIEKCMPKIAM